MASKKSNDQTVLEIMANLPSEIQELADQLSPGKLMAANYYLQGMSKLAACKAAGLLSNDMSDGNKRMRASNILHSGNVADYIQAVKSYHCSETVMSLHEIDIRLTKIARTEHSEIVRHRSVPVVDIDDESGEEVVAGYRTTPYLTPLEELNERQRQSIKSVKQTKNGLEVEVHDPVKAMDMLIKRKGGYTENVNNNVTTDNIKAFVPKNDRGPSK